MSTSTTQAIKAIWMKVQGVNGSVLSFPDTVVALQALGITRYQVDWVANTVTSYIRDSATPSSMIQETVDVLNIHPHSISISENFDAAKLKEAIRLIQQGQSNYQHFTDACFRAGVVGYITFITGKRVLYFGAEGAQHVEFFPGSQD